MSESLSVDDLPVAYGIGIQRTPVVVRYAYTNASTPDGATDTKGCAGAAPRGHPLNPALREGRKVWKFGQMPICMYGGLQSWVCAVCCRMGRDFRRDFCNFKE